jgi:hypothetical protein
LFEISWADTDPDSSAEIELFYDNDSVGEDGVLIVSGLNEDEEGLADSYQWNMSSLIDGQYYVYAIISDSGSSVTRYSSGSVTLDRLPPEIIIEPEGGNYTEGVEITISTNEESTIYYTLDGTQAGLSSMVYNGSIAIDETTTLSIMAVDNAGNETEIRQEVYVIETQTNIPPVAEAGEDFNVDLGDSAFPDGTGSEDTDNGPEALMVSWSFISVPDGSSLSTDSIVDVETLDPSFTPDVAGEYILSLVVLDGEDNSTDEVTVTCIESIAGLTGDLDGDGDIDRYDVNVIKAYNNQPASVMPECDIDGDGMITVLDARKLMMMCTCYRCVCP